MGFFEGLDFEQSSMSTRAHRECLAKMLKTLSTHSDTGKSIAQKLTDALDMIAEGEALTGRFVSAAQRQESRNLVSFGKQLRSEAMFAANQLLKQ